MPQDSQMPDADAVEEDQMQYGHESISQKDPSRPRNVHKTLPFHDLYESLFNPLKENTRKKTAGPTPLSRRQRGPNGQQHLSPHELRRRIIGNFISKWRSQVGNDFYPAMRLIVPDKDRDRAMYGLKEAIIAKLLIRVLRIPRDSEDGSNLRNWKLPGQGSKSTMAGDFAGRCYEVINKRPIRVRPGTMSVAEVNEKLDRLSIASKEEDQMPIFEHFYRNMNPEELMWLVRIILRQVHIGATERTILEIWHPDAENLFNVSSSLRRVCWELSNPEDRLALQDTDIKLMQCFQPQLAAFQMHSFEKMVARMRPTEEDDVFWIEEKLDGERMQLHMIEDSNMPGGKRFGFWSRKAKDYAYLYGNAFEGEDSTLTRHLRGAFKEGVRNIILDGEMITWNMEQDMFVAFGQLKTAANLEKQNPYQKGMRPLFKIFDCLYLNDNALTKYTLRDRRKALEASVNPVHRRFEIHEFTEARTADDIDKQLRVVVAGRSEGLVIKNPRSMYHLNERKDDWIKVKPEYMQEFGEALDCVVIGGYYGSGKRGGNLSSFLCGLLVNHPNSNPQLCYSFFKVGGGFTASDYAAVRERTEGKWMKWDPKKPPTEFIELGGGVVRQYERPDVWIKPEDSVVVEVKAASVNNTDQFRVGETLRFPRFKKLRTDKNWRQALTVTGFNELRENAEREKHEKDFKLDEGRRAKRARVSKKKPVTVAGGETVKTPFSGPRLNLFQGLTFFVITESLEPVKRSKAELEQLIKANGGNITQKENADAKVICVADRRLVKVQSIQKRAKESIVKPSWIFDSIKQMESDAGAVNYLLPMESKHMFFLTDTDGRQIFDNTDEFGDSYARDVTVVELREIFQAMPKMEKPARRDVELLDSLEGMDEDNDEPPPGWIFKNKTVYFYRENTPMDGASSQFDEEEMEDKLAARLVAFAGGRVAHSLDTRNNSITHVVARKDNARAAFLSLSNVKGALPRVVSRAWIEESWRARTLLDEERFPP